MSNPVIQRLRAQRSRWLRSRRPVEDAWRSAIPGEVGFWDDWLETRGSHWPADYTARLDANTPLQPELREAIGAPDGSTVKILDCGAGPLTWVGKRADGWDLEIVAVDVLADEYNQSLDRAGVVPPVRTQRCETERLAEMFSADMFDCVTARNTLDHTYDPAASLRAMIACTKPGAVTVVVHHRNVAEAESYHGLHQWNLMTTGGDLVLWRHGVRRSMGEELASIATIERTWSDDSWEWVVARKHA